MKILVTGVAGQLGYDVMNELKLRGHEATGTDLAKDDRWIAMDITDQAQVQQVIHSLKPDAVIHCAAWTAVDLAEDQDKQELVHQINGVGTENLATACKQIDAKLLYISTDYVFDGKGVEPWEPDCEDYQPLNVYGRTKLEGEQAVARLLDNFFVVRIAWVFGRNGNNFIRTMLNVGKKHNELRVVNDQIGTPTYTYDLARILADMIVTDKYGYYHVTNSGGYISWYQFAKEIFRQAAELGREEYSENNLKLIPVSTEEYGLSKAARPYNSRLDKSKLEQNGFEPLPDWKDAISRYLKEIDF